MKWNIDRFVDEWIDYFSNPTMWVEFSITLIKIVLIYVVGRLIIKVSRKAITRILAEKDKRSPKADQRRAMTLAKLTSNTIAYAVNFIVILMILRQFNVELAPLLAGAGVLGLAVGFGAQNLVKDVISGFFIIFEDQFAVGDLIQLGNYKGTVEEIGLRTTKLKSWTGEVHIIPNGSITEVTNFSVFNSLGVVDFSIAYEANLDKAIEIIKQEVLKIYKSNDNIVKEPEVLGVQTLGPSEVVIRVTIECKPNSQYAVMRQLNAEVKKSLEANQIEMAHPKMITYQR